MRALVTRACLYGLGVLGVVGGLAAGCSGEDGSSGKRANGLGADAGAELQQSADPLEIAERLAAHNPDLSKKFGKSPAVWLRAHGGLLLPARSDEGVGRAIGFTLSEKLNGPFKYHPIDALGSVLELTPSNAAAAIAELTEDSRAVYPGAFGNADLIVSAQVDHVQHTIVIRDSNSPDLFVWNWKLPEGMYSKPVDGDRLGIYDAAGVPQLTIDAARIVDAAGRSRSSLITFDQDGFARLIVDHRGLAYPIMADFSVFANAAQTLAAPPTIIKGRALVLLDTSGSMIWHFQDNGNTGGDSDSTAVFCDNNIGTGFACNANVACTLANGGVNAWPTTLDNPSRLYASKAALQNVINATSGLIDFGLERFIESDDCTNASNPAYCCDTQINGTTPGRCLNRGEYFNIAGNNNDDLTYNGGCGTISSGGRILVRPAAGSGTQLLRWVDFVEDFCSSTGAVEGAPRNPEIRGDGNTPLGRAVITARESWYRPIYNDSRQPGTQANDDPLIDCRPYSLIVMTDGADTCSGPQDCEGNDAACGVNNCVDTNTGNFDAWRCPCSNDTDCGSGLVCSLGTASIDCEGSNDRCAAGSTCIDLPNVSGTNWRCGCSTNADCGAGSECVGALNSRISCTNNNQCLSNNCSDVVPGAGTGNGCRCTSDAQCASDQMCDLTAQFPHCKPKICQARGVCAEVTPSEQVSRLTSVWQQPTPPVAVPNPVKTYVLGMGVSYQTCTAGNQCGSGTCNQGRCTCTQGNQCGSGFGCNAGFCSNNALNVPELEAMAVAGGTTRARFAVNQTEIEAAFADIVAQTVKYETCNTADDNCNGRIDEGMGVYQECTANDGGHTGPSSQCGSGTCNAGRCTCTAANQCATGFTCDQSSPVRFCRPACSVGLGACQQQGVKKCGAGANECCVNDASPTCTPLNPLPGSPEICNNLDDNCNGLVDENIPGGCPECIPQDEICDGMDNNCNGLVDDGIGGLPCGTDVGLCKSGTTQCPPGGGAIICVGAEGPFPEVCNGFDDNCDGVVDGMSRACYTGPPNTENVGICHAGTQICTAVTGSGMESWGACTGQQLPTVEVCNGLNDDCDCASGTGAGCMEAIDEGIPAPGAGPSGPFTGDACCPVGTVLTGGVCCQPGQTCDTTSTCTPGSYQCVGSVVACVGGQGPTNEICDMLDNDCNGLVDDLPGIGTPCLPPSSSDGGACAGTFQCVEGKSELFCVLNGMGTTELCNNLDDDCDGSIDEVPDVLQDPNLMGECNPPPAGAQGPCQPGHWVCKGGMPVCEGDIQPRTEVCNGEDDNCDGEIDAPNPCPGASQCVTGMCAEPCRSGEFPCPGGQVCQNGFCVPQSGGTGGAGGSAGAGQGGSGTGGTDPVGTGGTVSTGGVLGTGGSLVVTGGTTGTGGDGAGGTDATGGSSTAGTAPVTPGGEVDTSIYGLATGGGGCGCRVAGPTPKEKVLGTLLALGVALALGRRRRARASSPAAHAGGAR